MRNKVLCFGELLLRLSPSFNENADKHPFHLYIGGAEANTATALAGWNIPVTYCTALPDNFMSRHIVNYLEYKSICTSSIIFRGDRIGVYYLDRGADLKSSVVYDRDYSSFSTLKPGVVDWDFVFRDVSWLNISAINPALNQNLADVCLEGLKVASEKNIVISLDLNYRSRLWNYGKKPVDIMPGLVDHCDHILGNIWSAHDLLGVPVDPDIHQKGTRDAYLEHAEATSRQIISAFPKCTSVSNTFRFDKEKGKLKYYASLFTKGKQYNSTEYKTAGVVDRSGSGDCFMAGIIYGFYKQHEPYEIVDYATAAAFGKLQEAGDATAQDVLTVSRLKGDE